MAGYMTRAMKSKDPRYARILSRLGYNRRDMVAADVQAGQKTQSEARADDDLTSLRADYQEAVGKKPYHGWDAETLREKIAEAKE
jgi:hypothetical protein